MNRCPIREGEGQPLTARGFVSAAALSEEHSAGTRISVHGRPFSPHALGRCGQMHVDLAEVVAVLDEPDGTYPGSSGYQSRRVAVGRGLAVVFSETDATVITVLWDRRHGR